MPTEAGIANDSSKAIERRFRTIFHSQVQFIGLLSLDGTLLEANRNALAMAGVTEASVIGFEASHPTTDGQLIWVDFSISPFFGDDGRVEYLI